MNNLKKLFAGVAIVALLGTLVPVNVLGATYSAELQDAYEYAYANGITTMDSIEKANLFGDLTRIAMAKMMANYAIEVLGKTPDLTKDCTFPDVPASLDAQYDNGVTKACQLGLMGVGITKFNPFGKVNRAQYGTTLSRALWGDKYDGGDPYYVNHLNALKDAGIMNNISNPNAIELRGWTMLMMKRAAESGTTTPVEEEVKEGTLTLSSIGVDYTSVPKAGLVNFGSIKFTAAGADVKVYGVKVKRQGLSSVPTTTKVYFEKDGVRVSGRASFGSDDNTAIVTFTTPLIVKNTETVDVVMDLQGVGVGSEIQLVSTEVNSSAKTVNGSFVSASLRTADYAVGTGTISSNYGSTTKEEKASDEEIKLGEFEIVKGGSGANRAYLVQAVTINNDGRANLATYLKDVALYRDNVKVSTKTTLGAKTMSFVLNDEIKSTESNATYVIRGKIAGVERIDNDLEYDFYIKNKEDVKVIEKDSKFRTEMGIGTNNTIGKINVVGGDIKFVTYNFATENVIPGAKKVVFYTGYIETTKEVKFENLVLTGNSTHNWNTVLDNLYVRIGNTLIAVDELANATTDGMKFEGEVVVNGKVPVLVYGDIKSNYTGVGTINFTSTITTESFEKVTYVFDDSNAKNSNVGSITKKMINIRQAALSVSNSTSTEQKVQRGDRNVELAQIEFTTNSDVVSKIESFDITFAGTGVGSGRFNGAQVVVYDANGTMLRSTTISTTTTRTITLPTPLAVSKNNSVKLTLKLDQVPSTVSPNDTLDTTITNIKAREIINNTLLGTIAGAPVDMTKLVVVQAGTPEIITELPTATLSKYGTEVVLGRVKLKANNGNVVMKDVVFELTGVNSTGINNSMNKFTSIRLFEVGVTSPIATMDKTGTKLVAEGQNIELSSTPKTFEVRAFVTNVTNSGDAIATGMFLVFVNQGSKKTEFTNVFGDSITNPLGNYTGSAAMRFVKEIPTVTAVDAYTRGNDVVYKITFNAQNQVKLTNLKLSLLKANLSGDLTTFTAYVAATDNDYLANNYGTDALAANGDIDVNLINEINVVGETTVYVVVKGLLGLTSINSNNPYTRVELTNISYKDIFSTGELTNEDMMTQYKAAIAGSLNLNKQVSW